MKDINTNDVTSIVFEKNGEHKIRFVLASHRGDMYKMEEKMEENGCEPYLVVDKDDPLVWWCDDYVFMTEALDLDDDDAFTWALMVTECDKWWPYEDRPVYRTKNGDVVVATVSTMPCDERHGQCTDDCEPIEL